MRAHRDENRKTVIMGVSSVDLTTPVEIAANPTTHAVLIDKTPLDARYVLKAGDTMTGTLVVPRIDIDNITIDGNTISSTNTNGDIILSPNGSGMVQVSIIHAATSAGLVFHNSSSQDILLLGAGGGQNATFYDGVKLDAGTASRVLVTDANKNISYSTTTSSDLANIAGLASFTQGSVVFAGASGLLSQDNANLFYDDTNNRLGIGTIAPSSRLHVVGGADEVQFITKGNATQTNDIFQLQNSSSTVLARMNNLGEWGLNGAATRTNSIINATKTFTTTGASESHYAVWYQGLSTVNHASTTNAGFIFDVRQTAGSTGVFENTGIIGVSANQSANNAGAVRGARLSASASSSGGVSNLEGLMVTGAASGTTIAAPKAIRFYAQRGSTTSNVAYGIMGSVETLANGVLSSGYAIYILSAIKGASSTFTNNYGLYIENQTVGGSNWAIYTNTGAVRFGDTVQSTGRKQAVAIKSANYTLTANDEVVVFTATATATLPAATGSGQTYRIICRAGSTTIDANGSETIKGELTQTLQAGEDLIITDTASGIWE